MTIHSGERNYPCRFCDKRFSRRQDVRSHEKTVHIVDTEFKCIKCDQIFYSKKSVQKVLLEKLNCLYLIGTDLKIKKCVIMTK